jgi:ribosome recycling factor
MKKNLQKKSVQAITDNHIKSVDEKVSLKEKEIMTI